MREVARISISEPAIVDRMRGCCFVLACALTAACGFSPRASGTVDGAGSAVLDAAHADALSSAADDAAGDANAPSDAAHADASVDTSTPPPPPPACGGLLQPCCAASACDPLLLCGVLSHRCV